MIKRVLLGLTGLLLALAVALGVNTWRQGSRQVSAPAAPPLNVDLNAAAQRLAGALRLRTISSLQDVQGSKTEFEALHAYLAAQYPRVHATLQREEVGHLALLYTWKGKNPSKPGVLLMAHQDVVPVAPGTEKAWSVDPFAGEVKEGYIWGRGALDNKGNLFAQMEAVEALIGSGFQPEQTVYFFMGADEEVSGLRGAVPTAKLLKERGIQIDWVLDEGLLVLDGVLAGLSKPAALIGVAEKGYATFFLSLETSPGHSSMPPARSAIGQMSAALARLEANPMPGGIQGVAAEMFGSLAPEMSALNRVMLSNLWLTAPLVESQLAKSPSSNAMLRTTTALTIVRAGIKDNVLPGRVEAAVNFRVLPGESLASVEAALRKTLADDAIQIKAYPGNAEPSPIAPTSHAGYRRIERSVRSVFQDAVVAPGLMTAATDSRHFTGVTPAVYRFSPIRVSSEDLARIHGNNERLPLTVYSDMIRFYQQVLGNESPVAAQP